MRSELVSDCCSLERFGNVLPSNSAVRNAIVKQYQYVQ